jgi:hypothetical protein
MSDYEWLESILPPRLMDSAVDLAVIGCNELAWPREEVLEVAECLRSHDMAILGGDVLEVNNGKPKHTCDNWYVAKKPADMGWDDFVRRAYDRTVKYISAYDEAGRQVVYVLVFCTEKRI